MAYSEQSTLSLPMAEARLPWSLQWLLQQLKQLPAGHLSLTLPNGTHHEFHGQAPGPQAHLCIHNPAFVRKLLRKGSLGLAESYLDGDWDCEQLTPFLLLCLRNKNELTQLSGGHWLTRWIGRFTHFLHTNTRSGSRRNIAYHYDLGNAFYQLWLDDSMTYSSAVFTSPTQSLVAAQQEKYRRLAALIQPQSDQHILEIGCGWGSFALFLAKQYGCRVTGITLSQEQLRYAQAQAIAHGLSDRVEFRLQDYRDVAESFDHIVSIEMFEAVGQSYWSTFFQRVRQCLKPGGRVAMQVITIAEPCFEQYSKGSDFIQHYIFPGGFLPSPARFATAAAQAGLSVATPPQFYGLDYAKTLAQWQHTVLNVQHLFKQQGFDQRFLRMWWYYLAYCEAGFLGQQLDLMQVSLNHSAA